MKQLKALILFTIILLSCQKSVSPKEKTIQKDSKKVENNYQKKEKDYNFIYNHKIDYKNIEYKKIETSSISGLSKLSCDKDFTRYLELPSKEEIRLILIPLDCGDFDYRYYLLTIKNDSVVSNLYVEGVWSEPDSGEEDEKTSFSIDKNFIIQVKIELNNETNINKFSIDKNGIISKL